MTVDVLAVSALCGAVVLFMGVGCAAAALMARNQALSRRLHRVAERIAASNDPERERRDSEAEHPAKNLVATISHEIRTPLNGILGMADLLLATGLTPEQATYADAVKTSAEALAALIDEVLDYSKIEAGRLVLDPRPFEIRKLIEDVAELLAPRAQAHGLEIAAYVDDGIANRLVGDKARLRQVLLNLAGNAIKFTDRGGVSIIVEPAAPDASGAGPIALRVGDTGIGIATADLDRIFEEFEQIGDTPHRSAQGTGLGLAISRRLVRSMGGEITVVSVRGAGATFCCTIPLPAAADLASSMRASPDLSGRSVLLAGSGIIEAPLLARRLQSWGAQTRLAPTPEAAAALLGAQSCDILLVDSAVGDAAAKRLCSLAGDGTRKLVLVTPANRTSVPALSAAGFDGWLVKPVRAASLAARVSARVHPSPEDLSKVASCTAARRQAGPPMLPKPATRDGGLMILVVEDDEVSALLARSLLARLGHQPVVVTNGDDAIAACAAARFAGIPFDLILMDLQLPGLGGIEAARRIRAAEPEYAGSRTPIIAITARALPRDEQTCLAADVDAVMAKPLDRERLRAVLENFAPHRSPVVRLARTPPMPVA